MVPLDYCFILFLMLLHIFSFVNADSIQGCGGFVEASSAIIKSRRHTDAKLDYSHITVELRTLDGLVKERTQCAPNGYYFIPVYDKGSVVIKIKGPDGWSYAPEQVTAVVDHTGCNNNEDINFQFTGFTLSGRVLGSVGGDSCSHKNSGPSNVNVELLGLNGDVVSSVSTTSTGSYAFKNLLPGNYKLRASRQDLNIEFKGSTEVELQIDNGVVDDVFFASGYDVRGFVVAQGNPILGVHFYLYSDDIMEVDCPHDSVYTPGLGTSLCHAESDSKGMFMFRAIPCGVYKLIPFYKGENTVFDVSPPSMLVSVQQNHTIVPQKFQVTGFSIGGRVVDGNGLGVDGAKIMVDGHGRSITDDEGYYKLDQVTSKKYSIEATKKHYKFARLNNFLVLPSMAAIVDIKAVAYDVCGLAQTVSSAYKAKVTLSHGPENAKPQVKQTDESGNFCFEVPAGEYRISAFAVSPESSPELLFSPAYVDVIVNNPLLNVLFTQAEVNVRGSVVCKGECGSSLTVTLVRLDGKHKEGRIINLTNQSSEYTFSNVLPGKYRVEVKNYSPATSTEEDLWCWDQSSINVDVGVKDVEGIDFSQKGYWINIISTHDVDAYLIPAGNSQLNLKIKKGPQNICVESSGVHELHFIDSCISFGSAMLALDMSRPSPIYLKAEKYYLKGLINVELNDNVPQSIPIDMLDSNGNVFDLTIAQHISAAIDNSRSAVYEYSFWANFEERLSLVPRDSRNDGEKKILFYPRQQKVSVINDGCQLPIAPFSGRLGLYLEGSVSPPLSNVQIRVFAEKDSSTSPLMQGDIAFKTSTGPDGLYLAGPLYDDIGYTVEASKPGYYVKKVGLNSFSCQKLGQISVKLYSQEESAEPFPSVLLSLSGEDGYRNNSVSGNGGAFIFNNLFPGSFYLRPLLKEYAFSPPTEAVGLGSGESREVIFYATRVAFSAMGRVSLLSGQPREGVLVEARAESQGFYEEAITDASGSYRLRGLYPDTSYVIKIARNSKLDSSRIERASPDSVAVKVGHDDVKNVDFVAFAEPDTTILSGHVEGRNRDLRVEIRSASDPMKVEFSFPLPISKFFQVKALPKGKHLVQLRSAKQCLLGQRFESDIIEIDLEKQPIAHVGPLSYRFEEEEDVHKLELAVAPVYPLVVGVSVIALFISMPRLKDLYQGAIGIYATSRRDVRKPTIRKKIL